MLIHSRLGNYSKNQIINLLILPVKENLILENKKASLPQPESLEK